MTLYQLLESERENIAILRTISNRHPNDAETQRLCGRGFEEAAERVIKLNELLGYGDKEAKEEASA